jgi:predicted NBD/HSP70 family sugar kinase
VARSEYLQPGINGAGDVLHLIRSRRAATRAEVAALTGWARSTVAQRLDALALRGLIKPAGELPSTGGRPPALLEFNADAGVVLTAEVGSTHVRVGITDLNAAVLADLNEEVSAEEGPERILSFVNQRFEELLEQCGREPTAVFGIGLGLAAPVEFPTGRPVNPPIMPGWDGFEVAAWFRDRWNVAVLVENEVNMMAVGEHATTWSAENELLCVKIGTGIRSGIISGGRLHRGAEGAAGDIAHLPIPGHDDVVCHCGSVGCLHAVAGGGAIARTLDARGIAARTARDVVQLVRTGNPDAIQLVRESGRLLGHVLVAAVNILNPSVVVIGGDIAQAEEQVFAGVREVVYRRSAPLATRKLQIVPSQLHDRAALIGAAVTVIEHTLSPVAVDAALARPMAGARRAAGSTGRGAGGTI